MAKILIRRGDAANLPDLVFGEMAWVDDDEILYIGNSVQSNKKIGGSGAYLLLDASNDPVTGNLLLKPSSDSNTVFQIQKNDATNVFVVSTTNENVNIGGASVSGNYELAVLGNGHFMLIEASGAPTADSGYGKIWTQSDNILYFQDGDGSNHIVHGGVPITKSFFVTTQGLGANPDIYAAGYYESNAADANLTQASTTQTFGTANVAYAAHAFAVAGGAGSVDTGVVGLRVTGTSINDQGTRTTSDTETISADITALSTNEYVESNKKWLGTVTFELFTVSGSPTTYSLDFNYGFCKYDDLGNNDFTITDIEAVGYAGASDSNFDIKLIHHKTTGWTYHATAFSPITAARTLAALTTDHSTDDQLVSGTHFAWKRDNLSTAVDGSGSEGFVIFISSTANNAIEYLNIHVGVEQ